MYFILKAQIPFWAAQSLTKLKCFSGQAENNLISDGIKFATVRMDYNGTGVPPFLLCKKVFCTDVVVFHLTVS